MRNYVTFCSTAVAQPISIWANTREEVNDFFNSLRPFSSEEWDSMGWFAKAIGIAQVFFSVFLCQYICRHLTTFS